MRRLRMRATPDPDQVPPAFGLLADSPAVEETRLLEWNLGGDRGPTALFSVDGDHDGLADRLLEDPVVDAADVTPVDERRAILLLTLRPAAAPMAAEMFQVLTRTGLVVHTPVVYRDGAVHATLVGDAATLQSALDAFPSAVSVDVREVGEFASGVRSPALSDRQREAVLVGLDLGYYDVPRAATHRDVAARLGCAPSTASEHLQKAEAKLVRAAMDREEG